MDKKKTEEIARLGLLTSLALIASYVELLIPVPIGIPGVKLGLANLVIVWALYGLRPAEAFAVNGMRILLSGFMFGNLSMILYSLAGALLSFLCMYLAKRSGAFSVIGVSLAGGVAHNVGQLLVAMLVLESLNLIYYGPVLLLSGLMTGLLIGIVTREVYRRVPGFQIQKND
ncbi:MAG TPA: heptaprenyl diphosphate synthase [Lachnospiraceae bacterium]|nr:heptaprenyl diphosphate synthase [Lachnospiraceae bacterium]